MIKYLLCTAGGVAIGYYVAHQKLEQRYEELLDQGTKEAKDFYRLRYEEKAKEAGEDPDLTEAALGAAEALLKYKGNTVGPSILAQELTATIQREEARAAEEQMRPKEEVESDWTRWSKTLEEADAEPEGDPDEEPETYEETKQALEEIEALTKPAVREHLLKSIVPEQSKEPVNYNAFSAPEKKLTTAQKEAKYVPETISTDDFIHNVSGLRQHTVMYFSGDDILANERDEPLNNEAREAFLGDEIIALLKAGPEAMGGASTIYIRNTEADREFEIIWNSEEYVDLVGPLTDYVGEVGSIVESE